MAEEGVPAKVGAVLAFIGKPGESVDVEAVRFQVRRASLGKTPGQRKQPDTPVNLAGRKQDLGFISPVVAKIAAEHGVNLQQVQGTGLNGTDYEE
jgi:pyruvate/2-oxoglutarate dehydrogenase complex dihydrolipoamide acyltransferase (E2) component